MEDACSLLNWECACQEEAHETTKLKLSLFYSNLEMETRIACANEEIARKIDEALHLKSLLIKIINERDELRFKCQRLASENLILQQETHLILQQETQAHEANLSSFLRTSHTTYIEDDPNVRVVSSLASNENSAKSQLSHQIPLLSLSPSSSITDVIDNLVLTKRLPEKGKFLHAMMEAGPLLQNLLVVGHLPRWRNPPPQVQLNSIKIPQAAIPSSFVRVHGLDFPPTTNTKNHKVVHQSPLAIL